jgi:hypothetical protein
VVTLSRPAPTPIELPRFPGRLGEEEHMKRWLKVTIIAGALAIPAVAWAAKGALGDCSCPMCWFTR